MAALDAKERKRQQRARDKELNIKQLVLRVHEDDIEQIKKFAKELFDKRFSEETGKS